MNYEEAKKIHQERGFPIRRKSWPQDQAIIRVLVPSLCTHAEANLATSKYLDKIELAPEISLIVIKGKIEQPSLTLLDGISDDWEADYGLNELNKIVNEEG